MLVVRVPMVILKLMERSGDEPVSNYTRAKLFQEKGKQTPVFVRFSTVIHSAHSPETFGTPADLQLNSIQRTAIGIWSETI